MRQLHIVPGMATALRHRDNVIYRRIQIVSAERFPIHRATTQLANPTITTSQTTNRNPITIPASTPALPLHTLCTSSTTPNLMFRIWNKESETLWTRPNLMPPRQIISLRQHSNIAVIELVGTPTVAKSFALTTDGNSPTPLTHKRPNRTTIRNAQRFGASTNSPSALLRTVATVQGVPFPLPNQLAATSAFDHRLRSAVLLAPFTTSTQLNPALSRTGLDSSLHSVTNKGRITNHTLPDKVGRFSGICSSHGRHPFCRSTRPEPVQLGPHLFTA